MYLSFNPNNSLPLKPFLLNRKVWKTEYRMKLKRLCHLVSFFPSFSSVLSRSLLFISCPQIFKELFLHKLLQSSICTTHSCSLHPTFLTRMWPWWCNNNKNKKDNNIEEDLFLTYSTHVRFIVKFVQARLFLGIAVLAYILRG